MIEHIFALSSIVVPPVIVGWFAFKSMMESD